MVAAALGMLGVPMPVPTSPPAEINEARPVPSLEEHPLPREEPQVAALLAASDALVWRALERAGNRIRQAQGIKPPNVPAYDMHTLVHINGSADKYLDDAWSCATQVLDGLVPDTQAVIQSLDAYCRTLFAEQAQHSRDRLQQWLEVTQ
jgi:hypothetical protein